MAKVQRTGNERRKREVQNQGMVRAGLAPATEHHETQLTNRSAMSRPRLRLSARNAHASAAFLCRRMMWMKVRADGRAGPFHAVTGMEPLRSALIFPGHARERGSHLRRLGSPCMLKADLSKLNEIVFHALRSPPQCSAVPGSSPPRLHNSPVPGTAW